MNEDNIKKETNDIQKSFLDKVIIILVVLSCIFVVYKSIEHIFISKYDPIVPRKYQKEVYNLNKGEWILVEDEMSNHRATSFLHLLPDGNVVILGDGREITNFIDLFDTTTMKIIKRISLENNKCNGYNSTSLSNGNVFISGGRACLLDSSGKLYYKNLLSAEIFDNKTSKFNNVKNLDEYKQWYNSALLENGHILLIPPVRENTDSHIIYNPEKNEYYKANSSIKPYGSKFFKLENGDVIIFHPLNFMYKTERNDNFIYKLKENKFEIYEYLPVEKTMIQLDKEHYLTIGFTSKETIGNIYNIKTKKLIPVKNKINQTRRPTIIDPNLTLLKNGNVLILGINSISDKYKDRKHNRYKAYIYDRQRNIFYEIPSIPYSLHSTNSVILKNGDVLFAGGLVDGNGSNKLLVYKY